MTSRLVAILFLSELGRLGVNDQANYVYSQAITAQMCVNSPRIRVANLAYEVILDCSFFLLSSPPLPLFFSFFTIHHHLHTYAHLSVAKLILSILCKNFHPNCGEREKKLIQFTQYISKEKSLNRFFFSFDLFFKMTGVDQYNFQTIYCNTIIPNNSIIQ